MNEKPTKEVKTLPVITKFIMTIGELPTSYLISMTYLEQVTWLCNYLEKTIIPALNQNGEAVKELQELYELLRTYVNEYFDNLDIQEEINNKLEDMAESGQLTDIIAQYLGLAGVIGFDTVADMKNATNLINGSKCATLGFHNINDGGNAFYKIRTITNEDNVNEMNIIALNDNTLIAELIIEDALIPEKFGAYGDNTHDDTSVLQYLLTLNSYNHVILSKSYKISTGLDIGNFKVVDGGGSIHSSSSCLEINGHENLIIKDLRLYPTTNAIHIYSTAHYSDYNVFENIFAYGTNAAGSKGLFIEPTSSFITETSYRNCVFWNFNYGIYAKNESDSEMSGHKFTACSTETSTVLGQYIKNGNDFVFNNCRHVESISNKWKTEGTCNNLIINGVVWAVTNIPEFSANTNGQIINGLRNVNSQVTSPLRNGMIIKGYIIPCKEILSKSYIAVNSNKTIQYGDELATSFRFSSNNSDPVTLTLPTTLYGTGKIDEFDIKINYAAAQSIIKVGETTIATIPAYGSGVKYYKATCYMEAGVDKWLVYEITPVAA